MAVVYTLVVLTCLLTISLVRYLYFGWDLKKLLEHYGERTNNTRLPKIGDSSFIKNPEQEREVFVSGHYDFNNRRGLLVVVADRSGLTFKRFLLFKLLVDWDNIARISVFDNRAKIYFNDEARDVNSDCVSIPWSDDMTQVIKGKVAIF